MTRKIRVLRSINNADANRCVDIFVRLDSTFGFEEYRRDSEDNRGWFAIGFFAAQVFTSEEEAMSHALVRVVWLKEFISVPRDL